MAPLLLVLLLRGNHDWTWTLLVQGRVLLDALQRGVDWGDGVGGQGSFGNRNVADFPVDANSNGLQCGSGS